MTKRDTSKKKTKAPEVRVSSPTNLAEKVAKVKEILTIGITKIQQPSAKSGAADRKRDVHAFSAAEACELFGRRIGKGGGAAFVAWLRNQADDGHARPVTEWRELLEQFAARPIHGHRRGSAGGSHRPNSHQLRGIRQR